MNGYEWNGAEYWKQCNLETNEIFCHIQRINHSLFVLYNTLLMSSFELLLTIIWTFTCGFVTLEPNVNRVLSACFCVVAECLCHVTSQPCNNPRTITWLRPYHGIVLGLSTWLGHNYPIIGRWDTIMHGHCPIRCLEQAWVLYNTLCDPALYWNEEVDVFLAYWDNGHHYKENVMPISSPIIYNPINLQRYFMGQKR